MTNLEALKNKIQEHVIRGELPTKEQLDQYFVAVEGIQREDLKIMEEKLQYFIAIKMVNFAQEVLKKNKIEAKAMLSELLEIAKTIIEEARKCRL